jgi:hypothetical protein
MKRATNEYEATIRSAAAKKWIGPIRPLKLSGVSLPDWSFCF